jgi:molecular chaperone Hsp33
VASVLLQLGREDVEALVRERGDVRVDCEHCGRVYRFDAVDVAQLFRGGEFTSPAPDALQ